MGLFSSLPGIGGGGGGNSGFQQSGGVGGAFNKAQENSTTSTSATVAAQSGGYAINTQGAVTLGDQGSIAKAFDFAGMVNDRAIAALGGALSGADKIFSQALAKQTLDSGERVNQLVTTLAWAAAAAVVGWFVIRKLK